MNQSVIKVFIGYDPVESLAWHTMAASIYRHSSRPVSITPINIRNLKGVYTRERDPKQSNEFSFTRFLVPHLCNFEGQGIFFDCDMMLRGDIAEIFDAMKTQPGKAVYVVKHTYTPRDDVKYLNAVQYKYPRKNWSSVVLWDCAHPKNRVVTPEFVTPEFVTPEFVNTADAMKLQRFGWLDDKDIGELDVRWNWLVGEYDHPPRRCEERTLDCRRPLL